MQWVGGTWIMVPAFLYSVIPIRHTYAHLAPIGVVLVFPLIMYRYIPMFAYFANEFEDCTCCGCETLARVSDAGAVCEDCQDADDTED